jgi:hypothetical protein
MKLNGSKLEQMRPPSIVTYIFLDFDGGLIAVGWLMPIN